MIIDAVTNLEQYTELFPNIPEAIKAMESVENQEFGKKYFFEGGYFFFQEGMTKAIEDTQFEAHRKYADLQIVLKGEEYLAWNKLSDLTEVLPYDPEKDIQKFVGENAHAINISEGMAYICFPSDGHKAVFHVEHPLRFKKAVIKLELSEK